MGSEVSCFAIRFRYSNRKAIQWVSVPDPQHFWDPGEEDALQKEFDGKGAIVEGGFNHVCSSILGTGVPRWFVGAHSRSQSFRRSSSRIVPLDLPPAQVVVLDGWATRQWGLGCQFYASMAWKCLRINRPWNMCSGYLDFRPTQPVFIMCNWIALCGKRQSCWCLGRVWPRFISIKESLYWETYLLARAVLCSALWVVAARVPYR